MYLKLSKPYDYPFGLLSILNRENGISIVEDATRICIPKELDMNLPQYINRSYFSILEQNFLSSLDKFIEKHSTIAGLYRAENFFMPEIKKLRNCVKPDNSRYMQQLFLKGMEPINETLDHFINQEELAIVINGILFSLKKGEIVYELPYTNLVDKFYKENGTPAPLGDVKHFYKVDNLVSDVKEFYKQEILEAKIKLIKDQLMDIYLDKTLEKEYPHIPPELYSKAKEEQYLRNYAGDLEARIYNLWLKGKIPRNIVTVVPLGEISTLIDNDLFGDIEDMETDDDETDVETESTLAEEIVVDSPLLLESIIEDPGFIISSNNEGDPFPENLHLSYKYKFNFDGADYDTPIEYALRKLLSLFSVKLSKSIKTEFLKSSVKTAANTYLQKSMRNAIYELMLHESEKPHIAFLYKACKSLEWDNAAPIVGQDWLTSVYQHIYQHVKIPAGLDTKQMWCSDLTQNTLISFWFKNRIQLWKPVSIRARNLFLTLSKTFNAPNFRFPTENEKHLMAGCDSEVWRAIISDYMLNFQGTISNVYIKIITEITTRTKINPSVHNLNSLLRPIWIDDNAGFPSVNEMVSTIIDTKNHHMVILWHKLLEKILT